MSEQRTDTISQMSDAEFLALYGSSLRRPATKAKLDQGALGTGYAPRRTPAPNSESAKIEEERTRRGL